MAKANPTGPGRGRIRQRAPGRPSKETAEALQEMYLQVALEAFLDNGFAGTSIEEIARRAKASKVTLYRRYGSKAALFRLAVHHAISKVRDRLQPMEMGSGNLEDELRDIVMRLHTGLTDPEYIAVLRLVISETDRFPELGTALLSEDKFMLTPIADYLSQAVAKGKLSIPDPYAATMQLAALAMGGTRFLIKAPKRDTRSQNEWVDAVLQFALTAWQPAGAQLAGDRAVKP